VLCSALLLLYCFASAGASAPFAFDPVASLGLLGQQATDLSLDPRPLHEDGGCWTAARVSLQHFVENFTNMSGVCDWYLGPAAVHDVIHELAYVLRLERRA
jgi:hypothetical protein